MQYTQLCHLPSLGSGKTKNLEIVFDLRNWDVPSTPEGGIGNADTVRMSVDSGCSIRSQARVNLATVVSVRLDYVSDITVAAVDDPGRRQQLGFNRTSVPFRHTYRVTNGGPSPTSEEFAFNVYLPQTPLLNVSLNLGGGRGAGACQVMKTGRFHTGLPSPAGDAHLISCSTYKCLLYECRVGARLPKGAGVTVAAVMAFDAKRATDDPDGASR